MEMLKNRIKNDGIDLETGLLKVDSFLNHQLDIGLFKALGKEFYCRFGHLGINKILTIEASGIAVAAITSIYFDLVPVVFAKKATDIVVEDEFYHAEMKSMTKGTVSTIVVAKKCLSADDKVLIIDNFLAHGEAAGALASLVEQAGGTVCAITSVIDKEFAGGSQKLREQGYHVEPLVIIDQIENGEIRFKDVARPNRICG